MADTLSQTDIELANQKKALVVLRTRVQSYISGHMKMPPKDRARALNEIENSFKSISRFFDKLTGTNIQNTGTRFAAETLKQSFFSLQGQWKKFEFSLNSNRTG